MMNRILYFILITFVISTFSGCKDDEKYNTSHPDEGGIILTMDWSKKETAIPSNYQAYITPSSGNNKLFENLNGATNNLVVEPGEATIYVYNKAEYVSISGKKASISNSGTGIAAKPDEFYSYSGQVYTERDRDISHIALMNRQTGELKLSIAIKPAAMIDKIKTISAILDGVASELDMQTNELSNPSSVSFIFSKNSYYAVTMIRLFGFIRSKTQNLTLNIEFENGNIVSATSDLTSFVDGFNESKNKLFSLNGSLRIPDENAVTIMIDNWERNTENRYLSVFPSEVTLPYPASDESVSIITDQPSWEYSVIKTGDWLTIKKSDAGLKISATENTEGLTRQATIHISAGGLSESLTILQNAYEIKYYSDKEVVKLQSATIGKGVNIVMMGDGYTSKDMAKKNGKYEQDMRVATRYFFSVYPYTRYKDYFNVYMVTAISNEEGVSVQSTNTDIDTKFKSVWEGGSSTGISCSLENVIEYLNAVTELESADINDISVIMPINASIYAGTCAMYLFHPMPSEIGYGEGFSISMCPVGSEFEKIVVHEGAGHGFSKVTDEYIYYQEKTISKEDKDRTNNFKTYGWCENVDFYSDMKQTSWNGFADNPKYNMVSTFEGAETYGKGIWRPEYNSCMNNNIPYFNAPTRWAQVRRINKLAGFNYSFSQFLLDDIIPEYPSDTRSKTENLKPLAPPVMKISDRSQIKRR